MKDRIYGLDVLRILSMFGIIGLHLMNQGGIINNANPYSYTYFLYLLLITLFYSSVDIFAMLSGYLLINKESHRKYRIVELISIMLFWSFIITSIFIIFNINDFQTSGLKNIISSFVPPLAGSYWYITSYVFVFMLIPYINSFLKSISKNNLKKLLLILFVLTSIIPTLFFHIDFFRFENGYSPFWLIYMYMIGAYIKLYGLDLKTKKNIIMLLSIALIAALSNYLFKIACLKLFDKIIFNETFIDYISPFTIIFSILSLNIFSKVSINNRFFCKMLSYFSCSAFSVYIIHCHRTIYYNVLTDLLKPLLSYNIVISILSIVGIIVVIYCVCSLLDEIRKILYKLFRIDNLNKSIGELLDKIL